MRNLLPSCSPSAVAMMMVGQGRGRFTGLSRQGGLCVKMVSDIRFNSCWDELTCSKIYLQLAKNKVYQFKHMFNIFNKMLIDKFS